MKKKIMIAAGGTGGHIFPSIALAKQLKDTHDTEVLFVGGGLSKNRFFEKNQFNYVEVECGPLSKNLLKSLSSSVKIMQGIRTSRKLIKFHQPHCLVGFGSYYTFPTLVAAKLAKLPIILHEANAIPGMVNKLFSRYAAMTGIHMPITKKFLKGPCKEVIMPLRDGFRYGLHHSAEARKYFGLAPNRLTFLIFGGSQGAAAINKIFLQAILEHFPYLRNQFQIMHFTGEHAFTEHAQALYHQNGISACVKDFESRMDLAWSAADLVISRAGASTITEAIEFEVPTLLIPYPYAKDNHQEFNADFVVDVLQGGVKLLESQLTPRELVRNLQQFLENDCERLRQMRVAIKLYKQAQEKSNFADLVVEMLEHL